MKAPPRSLVLPALALGVLPALAFPGFLTQWETIYPSSTSSGAGVGCALCHASTGGGSPWNAYGWALRQEYRTNGASIIDAFHTVENLDSDGSGSSNLAEIEADTQPGWTAGPNNTLFFSNDSTSADNPPPAVVAAADPEASDFTAWIAGFELPPAESSEASDPDKDGHTNHDEYVFGGLPDDASSFPRPAVDPNGGDHPAFTVDVRTNDPSLVVTPSWSSDLSGPFLDSEFTTTSDLPSPFGNDYVRRTFNTSLGGRPVLFFRASSSPAAP